MPMIDKVDRYVAYELEEIKVNEWAGMKALMGMNERWQIESIKVLPLNGWRGRNLAEALFGMRDNGLLKLGTSKLVKASVIQDLPQWDTSNSEYLAQFTGIVAIEVVAVNYGYGHYITVTQMDPVTCV